MPLQTDQPTSNGSIPTSNLQPPTSNGQAPTSKSQAPTSNGPALTSNGPAAVPTSNGLPSKYAKDAPELSSMSRPRPPDYEDAWYEESDGQFYNQYDWFQASTWLEL